VVLTAIRELGKSEEGARIAVRPPELSEGMTLNVLLIRPPERSGKRLLEVSGSIADGICCSGEHPTHLEEGVDLSVVPLL